MKQYERPEALVEEIELNQIVALSPDESDSPEIEDEEAEEGEGLAKEIWGNLWNELF